MIWLWLFYPGWRNKCGYDCSKLTRVLGENEVPYSGHAHGQIVSDCALREVHETQYRTLTRTRTLECALRVPYVPYMRTQ